MRGSTRRRTQSLAMVVLAMVSVTALLAYAVLSDRYPVRKVDLNEYKRKQAAPGLKITPLAFGVGRRIPIVQKYVS